MQAQFAPLLLDPIVNKRMNESSWPLRHTANRHLFISILLHNSRFQYFPQFEVSPAENLRLLSQIAVLDRVEILTVVDNRFSVLYRKLGQAFVVPVDLDELADVEILFDMRAPEFLNGSYLVFEVSQDTGLGALGMSARFQQIQFERPVALSGSGQEEAFGWLNGK